MKKNRLISALVLPVIIVSGYSQNLVPNSSFEDSVCYSNWTHTNFNAEYWYNPNNATPDYFGTVSGGEWCGMGNITLGDYPEYPRTGNRCIGLWGMQIDSEVRDFVQVRLTSPLQQDTLYCAKLYLALADYCQIAIDRMGMLFTTDSLVTYPSPEILGPIPQVTSMSGQFLSDTSAWMELSGEFIAQGGEQYLSIGNHFQNSEVQSEVIDAQSTFDVAYYLVDDISVQKCSTTGLTTLEPKIPPPYPNPFNDYIYLPYVKGVIEFRLYDQLGKEILRMNEIPSVLKTEGLNSGVYFLMIVTQQRTISFRITKNSLDR